MSAIHSSLLEGPAGGMRSPGWCTVPELWFREGLGIATPRVLPDRLGRGGPCESAGLELCGVQISR